MLWGFFFSLLLSAEDLETNANLIEVTNVRVLSPAEILPEHLLPASDPLLKGTLGPSGRDPPSSPPYPQVCCIIFALTEDFCTPICCSLIDSGKISGFGRNRSWVFQWMPVCCVVVKRT